MRVTVSDDATADEVEALTTALAEYLGERVEAVRAGADRVVAAADPPPGAGAPTERERRLREEIAEIRRGGPEKYRERLAETGKLFVRDRLDLWFGGFDAEDGQFAAYDDWHPSSPEVEYDPERRLPADGLLTGLATFEGRRVHAMANDYTVKAGSMARRGVEKFLRMQERALRSGRPVLYLMDSSGGRIDEQTGFFANRQGIGRYYYNHSMLSGRVPQICVLYGPCIAGAAYTPVFADFTVMIEGMSAMAIASPRMVEMVTGEEISLEDLGGPDVHARHTGSADLVAADEAEARDLVADLLSYLPDRAGQKPPRTEGRAPGADSALLDEAIPESPSRAYDARDVLAHVVDADSLFELRPNYGSEILTAFARVDGRPVGVVASQPADRSGAIFPDAARKAAEFVWTCDAYEVPLLYLCDTPGFMAGSTVEREGILEAGKRLIYATSAATVPKQTVVTRKAYGAGIYAMGGPAYEPESVLALPSAEIAIMGPEAAVRAVYANRLDAIDDPEERRAREEELRAEYREEIDARRMGSETVVDEVVPPGDLREELVTRFAFYEDVERSLPERKHGTVL